MMSTLLLLSVAHAHVDGLLQGVDVLLGGGVGIEASFGLLRSMDGTDYSWLCHEAITAKGALITPRYAQSIDGVLLGVVPVLEQTRESGLALYRTEDGCDWNATPGLDGLVLSDVAFDPSEPDHALLITADLTDGAENHILRSTDAGQSFAAVLTAPERLFRTLAVSPAGAVWASAVWYDDGTGYLYRSADGETFSETAVPMPDSHLPVDVDVVAVSPDDPLTAWVVVGPYGSDVLLRTTDGGETFEEVFAVDGDIISGAAVAGGGVWLSVSGQTLYWSADGGSFSLVEDGPVTLGLTSSGSETWLATDAIIGGGTIAHRVTGGVDIVAAMHLSTLGPPPTCPADSHSATLCDPLWTALEVRLPLPLTGDTGEREDDGSGDSGSTDTGAPSEASCGCGSGADSAAVLLLVGLLGWRRRA